MISFVFFLPSADRVMPTDFLGSAIPENFGSAKPAILLPVPLGRNQRTVIVWEPSSGDYHEEVQDNIIARLRACLQNSSRVCIAMHGNSTDYHEIQEDMIRTANAEAAIATKYYSRERDVLYDLFRQVCIIDLCAADMRDEYDKVIADLERHLRPDVYGPAIRILLSCLPVYLSDNPVEGPIYEDSDWDSLKEALIFGQGSDAALVTIEQEFKAFARSKSSERYMALRAEMLKLINNPT